MGNRRRNQTRHFGGRSMGKRTLVWRARVLRLDGIAILQDARSRVSQPLPDIYAVPGLQWHSIQARNPQFSDFSKEPTVNAAATSATAAGRTHRQPDYRSYRYRRQRDRAATHTDRRPAALPR